MLLGDLPAPIGRSLPGSSSLTPNAPTIPFACHLRYNACSTSNPSAESGGPIQFLDSCGRQFIVGVRKWAEVWNLEIRFVVSEGPGSHGTLYAGDLKTTVKDRKKEIGKGLLAKMLDDLGIDRNEF